MMLPTSEAVRTFFFTRPSATSNNGKCGLGWLKRLKGWKVAQKRSGEKEGDGGKRPRRGSGPGRCLVGVLFDGAGKVPKG